LISAIPIARPKVKTQFSLTTHADLTRPVLAIGLLPKQWWLLTLAISLSNQTTPVG
jgi:hypothetical protein